MKKILLITIIFLGMGNYSGHAQQIPVYQIPAHKVTVNGYANFREEGSNAYIASPQGKREINVFVTTSYPGNQKCQATVWFYSIDCSELLGPYTATEDELLTKEIDFKAWGAFVESDEDILVSVWIGSSSQRPSGHRSSKMK